MDGMLSSVYRAGLKKGFGIWSFLNRWAPRLVDWTKELRALFEKTAYSFGA
jgi:hypothetical protein